MDAKVDYSKLRGRIREVFGTEGAFSRAMGRDSSTISAKLNNISDWRRGEIEMACILLDIPISEVEAYFFLKNS